jgi:hypothetical protein
VLSTLILPSDNTDHVYSKTERRRIGRAIAALESEPGLLATITGGHEGIVRLKLALSMSPT